jgi:excisionase family DNA binding protein
MASSSSTAAASQVTDTAASQAFFGFEPYVAAKEAAAFLGITPRRVKEMARAGTIPAHPVDPDAERKEWRFLLSELSAWMRANSGRKRGA